MASDWKSRIGRLVATGCGTQIGLLLSCLGLVGILLLCSVCALSGVLSVQLGDLAQDVARLYTNVPGEPAPTDFAQGVPTVEPAPTDTMEVLPTAPSSPVDPTPDSPSIASPPLKPVVIASMGGVNLRSGPSTSYERIGLLPFQESLEIVGRSNDSTWWLVSGPNGLAWVFAGVVAAENVDDRIPVVTLPPPLFRPTPLPTLLPSPTSLPSPTPTRASPTPTPPVGTPTAALSSNRIFVEDTVGYKALRRHLGAQPLSESFSPRGDQIAIIEGIKIHTVAGDGSYGQVWLDADETLRPVGGAVWSPDGKYIAFEVD